MVKISVRAEWDRGRDKIDLYTDINGYYMQQTVDLQNELVRQELIKAGWTPPATETKDKTDDR